MIYDNDRLVLVSGMIVNQDKEILLLHKIKYPDSTYYETPGGKVSDEDFELETKEITQDVLKRAVVREIREELGEEIRFGDLELFVSHEFSTPSDKKAIVHKFVANYLGGEPIIMEPHMFDHYEWVPIQDLEKYTISPDLRELTIVMQEELL